VGSYVLYLYPLRISSFFPFSPLARSTYALCVYLTFHGLVLGPSPDLNTEYPLILPFILLSAHFTALGTRTIIAQYPYFQQIISIFRILTLFAVRLLLLELPFQAERRISSLYRVPEVTAHKTLTNYKLSYAKHTISPVSYPAIPFLHPFFWYTLLFL